MSEPLSITPRPKSVRWLGTSHKDLVKAPGIVQRHCGFELFNVQTGVEPSDFKPMPSIGGGVMEIRVHVGTSWRMIYVAKFAEAVYVLHVFEKRSRKTSPKDVAMIEQRLKELAAIRRAEGRS